MDNSSYKQPNNCNSYANGDYGNRNGNQYSQGQNRPLGGPGQGGQPQGCFPPQGQNRPQQHQNDWNQARRPGGPGQGGPHQGQGGPHLGQGGQAERYPPQGQNDWSQARRLGGPGGPHQGQGGPHPGQGGQPDRYPPQAQYRPQQQQNDWKQARRPEGPGRGAPHQGQGGCFPPQDQNRAENQRQGGQDQDEWGNNRRIPWNQQQQERQGGQNWMEQQRYGGQQQQRRQEVQDDWDNSRRIGGWNQGPQQQQIQGVPGRQGGQQQQQQRQRGPYQDEWDNSRRSGEYRGGNGGNGNYPQQQQFQGGQNWNQGGQPQPRRQEGQDWNQFHRQGGQPQQRQQEVRDHDEWGNSRRIGACGHPIVGMNGQHSRQGGPPHQRQNFAQNQQQGGQHQPRHPDGYTSDERAREEFNHRWNRPEEQDDDDYNYRRPQGPNRMDERDWRQADKGTNSFEIYNSNFQGNQNQVQNPRNNQGCNDYRSFNNRMEMPQINYQQNNGGNRYHEVYGSSDGQYFNGNRNQRREQGCGNGRCGQQEQQRHYDQNYADNDRRSQSYVEEPLRRPESQNSYFNDYQSTQVYLDDRCVDQHSQHSSQNGNQQQNSGRHSRPVEHDGVLVEAPKENMAANGRRSIGVGPGESVLEEVKRQHAELRKKLDESLHASFGIFLPNPVEQKQWLFICHEERANSPDCILTLEDIGVVTPGVLEILKEKWRKEEEEKEKLFAQMEKDLKGTRWPAHPADETNGEMKPREQLMKEIAEQKERKELENLRAARLKALETTEKSQEATVENSFQQMNLKD